MRKDFFAPMRWVVTGIVLLGVIASPAWGKGWLGRNKGARAVSASESTGPLASIPTEIQGETIPLDRVIALPVASDPTVSFRVWFEVGGENDPAGKEGLASLTASMLTEGSTKEMAYEAILDRLFPLAAGYGSNSSMEMTVVTGRVHRDNLEAYYPLLIGAIEEPAFLQDDLDRLKSNAINYLKNQLRYSSDEELGKSVLYNTIFAGTPYGHLPVGTIESLESITLEDVKQFYREYYTRDNVILGIGGGYDQAFLGRLRRDLAKLPPGKPKEVASSKPKSIEGMHVTIVEKEGASTAISFGFPIDVLRGQEDWYALALANSWFGEHRNTCSHLFKVLRDARGLNYGDYSYIEHFPNAGSLQMPPANVGRHEQIFEVWIRPVPQDARLLAFRGALRELKALVENGLTESDFELTRNFLKTYVLHYAPSTMDRLAYAMDDRFYGIQGSHLENYRKALAGMTLEEVNAAVKNHLQFENMEVVFVTDDAEGLKEDLIANRPGKYEYPTPKSEAIMEEDKLIEQYPLHILPENIRIIKVGDLFEK